MSKPLEKEIKGFNKDQLQHILIKLLDFDWSDDLDDDFYEIIYSDEFKEIK